MWLRQPSARNVAWFGLGVLLALVAVDCALRLIEWTPLWRVLPVVQPILGHPDHEVGFDTTPGVRGVWATENRAVVRFNSLGLHDVERRLAKPFHTLRVGLTGDSMVMAVQVSEQATFGVLTERTLRGEGHAVEVINLGIDGPSPIRQLWRLQKRGYRLGLDLIVANSSIGAFMSGLLLDDSDGPAYVRAENGQLRLGYAFRQRFSQRHADDLIGRTFIALVQNSPVIRLLYLRSKQSPRSLLGLSPGSTDRRSDLPDLPAPARSDDCERSSAALSPMLRFWREHEPQLQWAAAARFLDDFSESARARQLRIIYLVRDIPLAQLDCLSAVAIRAELVRALEQEFALREMRAVDWSASVAGVLGDASRLATLQEWPLRRGAGHLNYEGHRVWAAALSDLLRRELYGRHTE